jgi:hypothetical protein
MKHFHHYLLIGLVALSCKKDKVPVNDTTNYYQSNGNFLVVKIGEKVEAVYEYNLSSIALNNDSLPLTINSFSNGFSNVHFWQFEPNLDTLFRYSETSFSFNSSPINEKQLQKLMVSLPYNSAQFQFFSNQGSSELITVWEKISNLDLVKTYRSANPNAKIGVTSVMINEFNDEFGFSMPVEKHLVLLVK